jgi:hypothetical protein
MFKKIEMKENSFYILFIIYLLLSSLYIYYKFNNTKLSYDPFEREENLIKLKYNVSLENTEMEPIKCDDKQKIVYDYLKKYPQLLKCKTNYSKKHNNMIGKDKTFDYSAPVPMEYHKFRINRAIIMYYPIDKSQNFKPEFLWFYRSWIEMQKTEPSYWRTDIIVFMEFNTFFISKEGSFFKELGCTFDLKRQSIYDKPMCILKQFTPIKNRTINLNLNATKFSSDEQKYNYFLDKVNIFNTTDDDILLFNAFLHEKLSTYRFADSIPIGFDGYQFFESSGYDLVIRSDIDVFLTPLFGRWLPKFCNDFCSGRAAYSHNFNYKRLKRVAHELKLQFANMRDLGSTWYSTPKQFRLVSYLNLFFMAYLASEVIFFNSQNKISRF